MMMIQHMTTVFFFEIFLTSDQTAASWVRKGEGQERGKGTKLPPLFDIRQLPISHRGGNGWDDENFNFAFTFS